MFATVYEFDVDLWEAGRLVCSIGGLAAALWALFRSGLDKKTFAAQQALLDANANLGRELAEANLKLGRVQQEAETGWETKCKKDKELLDELLQQRDELNLRLMRVTSTEQAMSNSLSVLSKERDELRLKIFNMMKERDKQSEEVERLLGQNSKLAGELSYAGARLGQLMQKSDGWLFPSDFWSDFWQLRDRLQKAEKSYAEDDYKELTKREVLTPQKGLKVKQVGFACPKCGGTTEGGDFINPCEVLCPKCKVLMNERYTLG